MASGQIKKKLDFSGLVGQETSVFMTKACQELPLVVPIRILPGGWLHGRRMCSELVLSKPGSGWCQTWARTVVVTKRGLWGCVG